MQRIPVIVVLAAALICAPTAHARVTIVQRGTDDLDGKVVMSPAAEHVEAVQADGSRGDITPGSTIERLVLIHNRTRQRIPFAIETSQVVGSDAELVVEIRHGSHEGAAGWVTIDSNRFTLAPGEEATVPIMIHVPKDASPGSHPFGITASQLTGTGFRQVAIFIVELPGDARVGATAGDWHVTPAGEFEDGQDNPAPFQRVDAGGYGFAIDARNTGSRLLEIGGTITIQRLFGERIDTLDLQRSTAYPDGETRLRPEDLEAIDLDPGWYTVRFDLDSDAGPIDATRMLLVT